VIITALESAVNQAMGHWDAGAAPRGRLCGRLIGRPLAYARGTVIFHRCCPIAYACGAVILGFLLTRAPLLFWVL